MARSCFSGDHVGIVLPHTLSVRLTFLPARLREPRSKGA